MEDAHLVAVILLLILGSLPTSRVQAARCCKVVYPSYRCHIAFKLGFIGTAVFAAAQHAVVMVRWTAERAQDLQLWLLLCMWHRGALCVM